MAGIVAHRRDEVYGDPGVHALSVIYFENIKNAPMAHRLCMDMLTTRTPIDDRAKFVCLSVIAEYIRDTYTSTTSPAAQEEVRRFLTQYITVHLTPRKIVRMEDLHVRSLAAEVFGRVGMVDYPLHWPDYFTLIVGMAGMGPKGVDHYLRTLGFISRSITGRAITEEVFDRNMEFVRNLQDKDFEEVLNAWHEILSDCGEDVKQDCMGVMCEYMVLMDPERFSRHRIVVLLVSELEDETMRTYALVWFHELLKTMQMDLKEHREFVGRLFQQLVSRDLARPDPDTEKFTRRMGAVLTAIGTHLLELCDKDEDTQNTARYNANLTAFFPYIVNFLDSKDIKISSSAIPFFINYTKFLQKRKKLSFEEYNNFIQILGIVLARIKMKTTYKFNEDSAAAKEGTFNKYREALMKLFQDIAMVKRKVVFKGVYEVILKHLLRKDWSQEAFNVAEYPVFLINLLSSSYSRTEAQDKTVRATRNLVRALLKSNIVSHPHPAVSLQYFQAIGNSVSFFPSEPKFIPNVLATFYKQGLTNPSYNLRCLCAEQFLLFVRGVSSLLGDSFIDIITAIQRVTIIPGTFIEGPRLGGLSRSAQLSLFEVTGISVCKGKFHKQNKRHFLAEILVPAMHMYHESCNAWATSRDQDGCAERICHAMDIVTRIARPFDYSSAATSGCDDVFVDTITILDHCAMSQLVRSAVHMAMAQLIRQMVVTLEEKFMQFIPKMMQGMFYCKTEVNVIEIMKILIFIVKKYKKRMFSYFKYEFLRICFHVYDSFTMAAIQNPVKDKQITKLGPRQDFFLSFLTALDENAMFVDIFGMQEEKMLAKLVAMITSATLEGARGDWRAKGFVLLTHIVDRWSRAVETHSKPFVQFVFNHIVMSCFAAMRVAIEQLDGWFQNYLEVFGLCSVLLGRMYKRRGDEMLAWLMQDYLPQLQVAQHLTDELIEVLVGDPLMTLEDYLKSFFFEAEGIVIPPVQPFIPPATPTHPSVHPLAYPS